MEIKGVSDFTISGIDPQSEQCYSGYLGAKIHEDEYGLRVGPGFMFCLNYAKEETSLWSFNWISGTVQNMELVKKFKGELINPGEVERLLKKYKLL